jgi:hypothetical protein
VYHGNMELLSDADGKWFAKVQNLYHGLQKTDSTETFGSIPGEGRPYGFKSSDPRGTLITVVNPSQSIMDIPLGALKGGRILYADGGFKAQLPPIAGVPGMHIILGPEQMAVVGFGGYAGRQYDLGIDDTIHIPVDIRPLKGDFTSVANKAIQASVAPEKNRGIRVIFRQFYQNGDPCRSWLGAPPDGKKVSEVIKIKVSQGDKDIPLHIEYDKMIWSGLSWGVGEAKAGSFDPSKPLLVTCSTTEKDAFSLKAEVYAISYV